MAFAISTRGIPSFQNYAEALERYNDTKPLRGTNIRPLDDRVSNNREILQRADGSIAFRLWRTDVVVFHPDGRVSIEPFNSQSTIAFANALLPSGIYATSDRDLMWVGCGPSRFSADGETKWYRPARRSCTLTFKPVGPFKWELDSDCAPQFQPTLDKARAKELRKALADFVVWYTAVDALEGIRTHIYMHPQTYPHTYRIENITLDNYLELRQGLSGSMWKQELYKNVYKANGAVIQVRLPDGVMPKRSVWE